MQTHVYAIYCAIHTTQRQSQINRSPRNRPQCGLFFFVYSLSGWHRRNVPPARTATASAATDGEQKKKQQKRVLLLLLLLFCYFALYMCNIKCYISVFCSIYILYIAVFITKQRKRKQAKAKETRKHANTGHYETCAFVLFSFVATIICYFLLLFLLLFLHISKKSSTFAPENENKRKQTKIKHIHSEPHRLRMVCAK